MVTDKIESDTSKISGVIVTYNPDYNIFDLTNVLIHEVGLVIIVDNCSLDILFIEQLHEKYNDRICIVKNSENLGIARALNQGVKKAIALGFNWVITFDQDSKPYKNIINKLINIYKNYSDRNSIGAISANFLSSKKLLYKKNSIYELFIERDYVITSGCLYPTDVFLKHGLFREDYFIDNVDLEFSLRLRKNNMILLRSIEPCMIHNVGNPQRYSFFGINFSSTNHNSTRRYYMSKNHVLLSKEYFLHFPFFILKTNFFYFRSLLYVLLFEKKKIEKLYKSSLGLIDGFFKY